MKLGIILSFFLLACSSNVSTPEVDGGSDAYNGCTETCDGICTCPPEYNACVAQCGSEVRHCMPSGALNEEGCLSYTNDVCVNSMCISPNST
jgi:hypothetical protein